MEPLSLRIVEFLEDKFFSPHFPVGAFFFADFLTGLLFHGDDVGLLAIQPLVSFILAISIKLQFCVFVHIY